MNRIDVTLEATRQARRLALFPYLMMGYPTLAGTERLALAAIDAGADGLELGIPFSDPVADGVPLQRAGERARANGATPGWTLEVAARLRSQTDAPLLAMTYYNPIHRHGMAAFVKDAAAAGIDGLIVPDLPLIEASEMESAASQQGLYLILFAAPTSTDEHLAEVGRRARGFVYCVALVGTTGARAQLSEGLPRFMARVRKYVAQPLLVGFGISRPEHVASLREYADGCIVGGAIADLLDSSPPDECEARLRAYVASLRAACEPEFTPAS